MRVAIYPRVSSLQQAKAGDSIEAQTARLTSFCKEKGYEIVGVYTDAGKSASLDEDSIKIDFSGHRLKCEIPTQKRPGFEQLLSDAKEKKFDAIVFYKYDRFARSVLLSITSQIYFKSHGVQLIPTDDSSDTLVRDLMTVLNQQETRLKNERVRLVRQKRFEQGVMVGRAPFGYRFNKQKKLMEVDKRQAEIVRQVFQMTIEGKGYADICKETGLNPQSYYNIIRNKVYYGIVEFEGQAKMGVHQPIIDEEAFRKANERKKVA